MTRRAWAGFALVMLAWSAPAETVAEVRAAIAAKGPRLETSRRLIRAGLAADDRAAVIEGVDGYYHVSEHNPPPDLLADAYRQLSTAKDDHELARALARLRFFEEASLIAEPDSEIAKYAALLDRLRSVAERHYRNVARGNLNAAAVRAAVAEALNATWPGIGLERGLARMENEYGAYVRIPENAHDPDLDLAHKISDTTLQVEQYGRGGTVRFIQLDAVVSNGFGGWQSRGKNEKGGWASASEIYRVRPLFADRAIGLWFRVTDPEERGSYVKKGEAATLEALAARLHLQYLDRVFTETKTRDAFVARVEKDTFHFTMVLHEGRHAIDGGSGLQFKASELEYRAKLSQVALSDAPRLAVADILADTRGESPHAKANAQIVRQLQRWLETNAPAVRGVQHLDRLTDDEIRAAFASLDPFARQKR